jgi:uroporphyrinogen-III synthase
MTVLQSCSQLSRLLPQATMTESDKLRIWLTRSEPGASRQSRELRAAGYDVWLAPVLEVEATAPSAPASAADIVVFLSEHAVLFTGDLTFCEHAQVFALGRRTQEVLAERGIHSTAPEDATSEGLLALREFADVAGQRIVLVAGEGGREHLLLGLRAAGATVTRRACYRRFAADDVQVDVAAIDAILAASGDGATLVARVWFPAGGRVDIPLLVPSQRVVEIAGDAGFTRVVLCSGADSAAWLEALANLYKTS